MIEGITNNYNVNKRDLKPHFYSCVSFQAIRKSPEQQPQKDKIELKNHCKKDFSATEKAAIVTVIALSLAVGADFLLCKGKHLKNLFDKFKGNSIKQADKPKLKSNVKPKEQPNVKPKEQPNVKPKEQPNVKPKEQPNVKPKIYDKPVQNIDKDLQALKTNQKWKSNCYTLKDRYEENTISPADAKEKIAYFEKLQSVLVDESSKLRDYKNTPYDMPFRFMISTNEKFIKNGSAMIVDEIPEMFKGIEQKELQKVFDNLEGLLDINKINEFHIGSKKFSAEFVGSGAIGRVFKISDEYGRSVAVKYFVNPLLTGLQGAYAEIPIAREASREGVIDVAKFFMANPCGRYDTLDGRIPNKNVGGWQMVEFIEDSAPLKNGGKGIKFIDWLKSHGLAFGDFNSGTMKGEYFVDVGGVVQPNRLYNQYFISEFGTTAAQYLLYGYTNNEVLADVIKTLSKSQ